MHSNIATNITPCLPHSTLQQLFVAMHVTMAMSCSHKAVSDPDPHLPTGSMSCPSLSLSPRRCLMLRCPWLPAPDCQSHGTSLHSPGSCQPSLHPGSFEPCSQDLQLFCYSQPCVSLCATMCFLFSHFQLLLLDMCALLLPEFYR